MHTDCVVKVWCDKPFVALLVSLLGTAKSVQKNNMARWQSAEKEHEVPIFCGSEDAREETAEEGLSAIRPKSHHVHNRIGPVSLNNLRKSSPTRFLLIFSTK